jgi:hypothetical protein
MHCSRFSFLFPFSPFSPIFKGFYMREKYIATLQKAEKAEKGKEREIILKWIL